MLWDALGWTVLEATVPRTLLMAAYMTIGMSVWMIIRRCSWPAIAEMGLAMFVPFVMMYPFYWAGLVNTTAVMVVGHVLMVPAMIVAMLLRKDEYTRSSYRKEPVPESRELAAQAEG
jgi:flagellar biosynthetic protein FliP